VFPILYAFFENLHSVLKSTLVPLQVGQTGLQSADALFVIAAGSRLANICEKLPPPVSPHSVHAFSDPFVPARNLFSRCSTSLILRSLEIVLASLLQLSEHARVAMCERFPSY
jgi:hypothetical protein